MLSKYAVKPKKKVILATASSSRRASFALLGIEFEAIISNVDENAINENNPRRRVLKLSEMKAKAVAEKVKGAIVIGADLIVTLKGKIYEKPKDMIEAEAMLKKFSGKEVEILAGVTAIDSDFGNKIRVLRSCKVKFMKLSDWQIRNYLKNYPVLSFSGAFDGNAVIMFGERVVGDTLFYSGLPLAEVYKMLVKLGALDDSAKQK
ncbi:MAG: Maf family nucleotide pyrophosphatase [Candidatus Diapherotrites archaeon]|nr:Maf family nucleotide pyrophosphatase [Candidatus Diapherotrites archaeon]